jgi:hypothetical protein
MTINEKALFIAIIATITLFGVLYLFGVLDVAQSSEKPQDQLYVRSTGSTSNLANLTQPTTLTLAVGQGILVTIHPDGRIDRGPAFTTTDQASLDFWRVIDEAFPRFLEQKGKAQP